jgi:hypothetical protein
LKTGGGKNFKLSKFFTPFVAHYFDKKKKGNRLKSLSTLFSFSVNPNKGKI